MFEESGLIGDLLVNIWWLGKRQCFRYPLAGCDSAEESKLSRLTGSWDNTLKVLIEAFGVVVKSSE